MYDSTVLGLNPEAYWKLNDAAGSTTVADSSGNSYTGTLGTSGITLGGASAIPSEPSETSLTTTGATFVATSSAPQSSVVAWSASAWFKTTSTTSQMVITGDRGSSGSGISLTLSMGSSYPGGPGSRGDISFGVDSNALYEGVYTTNTFNDGNWHFVVATWAAASGASIGSGQFAIYVDGVAQSTTYISVNHTGGAINSPLSGSGGIFLGDNGVVGSGYWNFWDGSLAQIALFTTQLSSTDVTNLWNASQNTGITIASVITGSSSATSTISDAESLAFSISGSSSLSATIIDNESMSTAIGGSSSMSASLVDNESIGSDISGSSSMIAAINDSDTIVANLSGSSATTASILDTEIIDSSITGTSSLLATINDAESLTSAITGSSRMTISFGAVTYTLTSSMDGSSAMSSSITDNESISSSLSGASSMSAVIQDADTITSNLNGSSSALATISDSESISSSITGSSSESAAISVTDILTVSITGSSSMTAIVVDAPFTVSIKGSSSMTATLKDTDNLTVAITGSSLLSAMVFDNNNQPLSVQQIYDILNPEWWSYSLNAWNTGYISTQINYKNNIVYNYLSTVPIQNYGINEGNTGIDIPLQVESLRLAAAQALADLHCTEIIGYTKLNPNQIAGAQQ